MSVTSDRSERVSLRTFDPIETDDEEAVDSGKVVVVDGVVGVTGK